jgi:hypothetical protein
MLQIYIKSGSLASEKRHVYSKIFSNAWGVPEERHIVGLIITSTLTSLYNLLKEFLQIGKLFFVT